MPFDQDSLAVRHEFAALADRSDANMSALCRRFGISRPTGYKWLRRYQGGGRHGLRKRSRKPKRSPNKTPPHVEAEILKLREEHPVWGGRKLSAWLHRAAQYREHPLGPGEVPAASTITDILNRNGLIGAEKSEEHTAWKRFERPEPNDLWQMDFKGRFRFDDLHSTPCFPLTVLDDHSRFCITLRACRNRKRETVREHLEDAFRRYGLPRQILMDNGPPWGSPYGSRIEGRYWTRLGVWMMDLGIEPIYSRPLHPQTMGKDERFHRTLKAEVLRFEDFSGFDGCQERFDAWRRQYNEVPPHGALDLDVPVHRYQISARAFPEQLSEPEYGPNDHVRQVQMKGDFSFRGHRFLIGDAFHGKQVAVRPTTKEGVWAAYFRGQKLRTLDVNEPSHVVAMP